MLRAGMVATGAATVVALFMIAAPLDGTAFAQPEGHGHGRPGGQGGPGPAARPAPAAPAPRAAMPPPAARPAMPPPAAMRPAPAPPQVSRPAPQPHFARPAAPPAPHMQRPQPAPRFAAPSRPSPPRVAAPTRPSPAVQRAERAAPPPRVVGRPDVERRAQQTIGRAGERAQSPQLSRSDQRELRRLERSAEQQQAAGQRLQRLQARSQSARLSRIEQRELRRLQQSEQQPKSTAQRLQQLQARSQSARLSRSEQRELRGLERKEQLQKSASQRLEELQTRSQSGRLGRAEQRELRALERQQRALGIEQRQAGREPADIKSRQARVTSQQATAGRFAASFAAATERRGDDWRLRQHAPRAAFRLGLRASYVPWVNAVYWPYAYSDVFYYTFWPDAYEDGYWAYAYDDFFDGIYFPYGAPHLDYAYSGPYGYGGEGVTTGSTAPSRYRTAPGRVSQAARALCTQPDEGITAWPIAQIAEAVQPSREQRRLLDDLKRAAESAADEFSKACPESLPMTPPGRLQAMSLRLQATLQAVKTVRPALQAFYTSLSDEQKARFNEIRPKLKEERTAAAQAREQRADCGGQKAGLSALPIDEIDRVVRPAGAQTSALDRLDKATRQAVDILNHACPTSVPSTPVGRLEVMEKRLEAMIEAGNKVRPALQDFYASLSDDQKAKFNRLGRDSSRG